MRQLTADTIIRIKKPRPELTGDTKIRLSQIADLAAWHKDFIKDKHSGDPIGTTKVWKDGLEHIKTAHGWKVNTNPGSAKNPTVKAEKQRLEAWSSPAIYNEAKNLSKEEIYAKYPNTPKPIAMLPDDILQHFAGVTNRTLYCGKAYFIDHMIWHHPEVDPAVYKDIQDLINNAQKHFFDEKQKSLVIAIEPAPKLKELLVIKRAPDTNKLVLYKSRYYKKENNYPGKFTQINPGEKHPGL